LRRLLLAIGSGALVLALLVGGVLMLLSGAKEPVRKVQLTVVNILPPPPPPPPPPTPPPPPPEQKVMEEPIKKEIIEEKPQDEKPEEPPPGPLALDAKGEGPGDAFNLGGKPGGKVLGTGGGGGGGSRWGWYDSQVISQVEAALRANEKTRRAVVRADILLWADPSGRVTRVKLTSSTGDADLDAAVRDQLGGMTLHPSPPKDMPMPFITRLTEHKPS
jgi:outer membrane biosynthesis protein TonB